MDPEVKKLLDQIGTDWKAYREANDARMVAIEKGQGHAELDAKLAAMDASLLETKAMLNRMNLGGAGAKPGPSAIITELTGWMRSRPNGDFKASVNTTTNADGGYLALPEIAAELDRVAGKSVAMRGLANVKTIGKNSLILNVNKGGVVGGWTAETGARTGNTTVPALAQVEITPREIYVLPAATNDSLEDLGFDVAAWLADEAATSFSELEDYAFILGDGDGKPKGILAQTMVANASYAWEKIGYIASGKSGAWAETKPADYIIDLVHALKAKYRNNASFLMNDATLCAARKLVDGDGNYLWQPSFQLGVPDKLLGYPVAVSDNMPDIAANSYSIAFGDFNRGYQIVDRAGIRVLADPYSAKGFMTFYVYKRTGGDVKNFEAIKVMKFAAS